MLFQTGVGPLTASVVYLPEIHAWRSLHGWAAGLLASSVKPTFLRTLMQCSWVAQSEAWRPSQCPLHRGPRSPR